MWVLGKENITEDRRYWGKEWHDMFIYFISSQSNSYAKTWMKVWAGKSGNRPVLRLLQFSRKRLMVTWTRVEVLILTSWNSSYFFFELDFYKWKLKGQWTTHTSRGDTCPTCVHHCLLLYLPTEFAIVHEHKILVGSQYMGVQQDSEHVQGKYVTSKTE